MLDTVDDHAGIITEDDIAVLAHEFNSQCFPAQISHFIQVFNLKIENPFHSGLCDAENPAVLKMLAEKHAEIRSRYS